MANETTKTVEMSAEEITANEATSTFEMTPEGLALREELAGAMAAKVAEGKAVWQVDKNDRAIMHMPINHHTGNYFQSGNALLLIQAQHEKGTADNRWISTKALKYLEEVEHKDIKTKKGEIATTIVSGGKPAKYFNYSQLWGKDVPNGIEIVDKTKDTVAEYMLNYMVFKKSQAKEKAEVTKENFWELAGKAMKSATAFAQKIKTELDEKMSLYEPAMPEFEKRLDAIKSFDREAKPKNNEDLFMQKMSWNLIRRPEKNNYAFKAAASLLIKQVPEKEVSKLIDKYAPEAAKDAIKMEQGEASYSKYVMGVLKKDKMLQQKIAEEKNKSAAR